MSDGLLVALTLYVSGWLVAILAGLIIYALNKGPGGDLTDKRDALNMIRHSFIWPITITWAVARRIPRFLLDLARDLKDQP